MLLEIGGGSNRREGYENIDLSPAHASRPEFVIHVGVDPIPLLDGSVDRVFASHVMEHIPIVGGERITAMNEIHRVLRPGGEFEIIVPCIGYTAHEAGGHQVLAGWQGWADPTHSSQWWFPESFWYFTGGPGGSFRAHADYGILYWEEVSSHLKDGWEAHVTLRKP